MGINSKKNHKKLSTNKELKGIFKVVHDFVKILVDTDNNNKSIHKHYKHFPHIGKLLIQLANDLLIADSSECRIYAATDNVLSVIMNNIVFRIQLTQNHLFIYFDQYHDSEICTGLLPDALFKLLPIDTIIEYTKKMFLFNVSYNKVIFNILTHILLTKLINTSKLDKLNINILHITTNELKLSTFNFITREPLEIVIPIINDKLVSDQYILKGYDYDSQKSIDTYMSKFTELHTDLFIYNNIPNIIYNI